MVKFNYKIVIFLLIIIVGGFVISKVLNDKKVSKANLSPKTEIKNQDKIKKTELSIEQIKENLAKQEKTAEIIKSKDLKKCDEISDVINDIDYHIVCVNNIAMQFAEETQDISYCEKINSPIINDEKRSQGMRQECEQKVVFNKSLDKEDVEICKEAKDSQVRQTCEDIFYVRLAVKKTDVGLCDKIQEKEKVNACYNSYYFDEFLNNKESFSCAMFKGEDIQNDCKKLKEKIEKNTCSGLKTKFFSSYCLKSIQ